MCKLCTWNDGFPHAVVMYVMLGIVLYLSDLPRDFKIGLFIMPTLFVIIDVVCECRKRLMYKRQQ